MDAAPPPDTTWEHVAAPTGEQALADLLGASTGMRRRGQPDSPPPVMMIGQQLITQAGLRELGPPVQDEPPSGLFNVAAGKQPGFDVEALAAALDGAMLGSAELTEEIAAVTAAIGKDEPPPLLPLADAPPAHPPVVITELLRLSNKLDEHTATVERLNRDIQGAVDKLQARQNQLQKRLDELPKCKVEEMDEETAAVAKQVMEEVVFFQQNGHVGTEEFIQERERLKRAHFLAMEALAKRMSLI